MSAHQPGREPTETLTAYYARIGRTRIGPTRPDPTRPGPTRADPSRAEPRARRSARMSAADRPSVVIRPGLRFFSRGLNCYCEVLEVCPPDLRFATVGAPDPLETDCPLDLAAEHFRAERWDPQPDRGPQPARTAEQRSRVDPFGGVFCAADLESPPPARGPGKPTPKPTNQREPTALELLAALATNQPAKGLPL